MDIAKYGYHFHHQTNMKITHKIHYGKKRTEETKNNMRLAMTGKKRNLSPEVRSEKARIVAENKIAFLSEKFANIDFSNAQELYDAGMSYKKLAEHYGVSIGKIQGLGLKTRSYRDAGKIRFITSPVSETTRDKMRAAAIATHQKRKQQ